MVIHVAVAPPQIRPTEYRAVRSGTREIRSAADSLPAKHVRTVR